VPCWHVALHKGTKRFFIKPTECDGYTIFVAELRPQEMIDQDLLDVLSGMLTHSSGSDIFSSVDYSPRFDIAQLERGIPINTAHISGS
jgi:hypothetical protein